MSKDANMLFADPLSSMIPELDHLVDSGMLEQFDRYWIALLQRLDPDASQRLLWLAAFTRRAVDDGHVCLDLAGIAENPEFSRLLTSEAVDTALLPEALMHECHRSPLVGDGAEPTPLVLVGSRLYLHRYWFAEQELAGFIRHRAECEVKGLDQPVLADSLDAVLAGTTTSLAQRQACEAVFRRRLGVITGGPGTGKTTVVASLLALMTLYAQRTGVPLPRLLLLAPTGKAAARLSEAIQQKKIGMAIPSEQLACLPDQAATIHRALGFQRWSPSEFRHHAGNPLPYDVVVVDEASMVDMALMARLFAAVRPDARLVLLGDQDQLSSVEAGSILSDICEAAAGPGAPYGLAQGVVTLTESFRFGTQGIGRLARAVNCGDADQAVRLCREGEGGLSLLPPLAGADSGHLLARLLVEGYAEFLGAETPLDALVLLERFRVLVAHRRGPFGVEVMNRRIEVMLAKAGLLTPVEAWYRGRPILVRENSYRLGLFNGDTGVVWPDPESGNLLAFFFAEDRHSVRAFAPTQLPLHEPAFAMTIHQSQGSEFDAVALLLPPADSPLLGRELLYTAITRARHRVTLIGREEEIAVAVNRRVARSSGLREMLAKSG